MIVDSIMALFKTYVGIDYSGAKTTVSRNKGLRAFNATQDSEPTRVAPIAGKKFELDKKRNCTLVP